MIHNMVLGALGVFVCVIPINSGGICSIWAQISKPLEACMYM